MDHGAGAAKLVRLRLAQKVLYGAVPEQGGYDAARWSACVWGVIVGAMSLW